MHIRFLVVVLLALAPGVWHGPSAQPNSTIDLRGKKPVKYQNRTLISEKSGETNFSAVKHFFQNLFTRFNYHFNALQKMGDVIDRAKAQHVEDYNKLLPFYNYTFANTAKETVQIDSIIYKCTSGILLHDLRDDWVDNMYLIMGKAYLLKENYDSAAFVFQWINYAWGPKSDGYPLPIGSNISKNKGLFTISTEEKHTPMGKLLHRSYSRNEALIWKVRTYLEKEKFSYANGLITLLWIDPLFPQRLKPSLHEMSALSYYKQQTWDSAAWHLTKALPNADGRPEKARWEFLIAQLYGMTKKHDSLALSFYEKSIRHTEDPLMEAFARINMVGLSSNRKGYTLQDNLDVIYRMAKRDKYEAYRDVLYYTAAILELQRHNLHNTVAAALNSLKYNIDNPAQRQKTYLMLADSYFDEKEYKPSYQYYDSIDVALLDEADKQRVLERKPPLKDIAEKMDVIHYEDSVRRVAAMTEEERKTYIKKLLKRLRKEEGLKEEEAADFGSDNGNAGSGPQVLFTDAGGNGEFYFNNPALKQAGFTEFKTKWGNRPNADNWRRQAAVQNTKSAPPPPAPDVSPSDMVMDIGSDIDPMPQLPGAKPRRPDARQQPKLEKPEKKKDLSFEGLMADVPLRQDQKELSDSNLADAYFENGTNFQNRLRDYGTAADNYKHFAKQFPKHRKNEQGLYYLYYCLVQTGRKQSADSLANVLRSRYPKGVYTAKLAALSEQALASDTTAHYQNTYLTFTDKKYEEANKYKLEADKKYGPHNWTPQLLFIESVYHITEMDDSVAIDRLTDLVNTYPNTALTEKSLRMIELLRLRWSSRKARMALQDSLDNAEKGGDAVSGTRMTIDFKLPNIEPPVKPKTGTAPKPIVPATTVAPTYKQAADSVAKTVATVKKEPFKKKSYTEMKNDTTAKAVKANSVFTYDPNAPHFAILQLDDISNVFILEMAEVFGKFNASRFPADTIDVATDKINDRYSFLYFGMFPHAKEALDYIAKTKPSVRTTIIPWLPPAKYRFGIIDEANLLLLQQNNNVELYNQFLKKVLPNKF